MNKTKSIIITFLLSFLGVGTLNAESYYTYGISPAGLGTLCWPNTVNFWKQVPGSESWELKGFRAFTVTGINTNNVLVLNEIPRTGENDNPLSIPAETPVIIYGSPGTSFNIYTGRDITTQKIVKTSGNLLVGVLKDDGEKIQNENYYVMQMKTTGIMKFYQCKDYEITVPKYGCYLDLTGVSSVSAKSQPIGFSIPELTTTAICNPQTQSVIRQDGIYNINGVRVETPEHGKIYIMVLNGQTVKMMIK